MNHFLHTHYNYNNTKKYAHIYYFWFYIIRYQFIIYCITILNDIKLNIIIYII